MLSFMLLRDDLGHLETEKISLGHFCDFAVDRLNTVRLKTVLFKLKICQEPKINLDEESTKNGPETTCWPSRLPTTG